MILLRILTKSVNKELLIEELVTAGVKPDSIMWAGFAKGGRVVSPNPGPLVVGRRQDASTRGVEVLDTAVGGELRFKYDAPPNEIILDAVLVAHDSTQITVEQDRQDVDATEGSALTQMYKDWDGSTLTQRQDILKRMLRVLARTLNGREADI